MEKYTHTHTHTHIYIYIYIYIYIVYIVFNNIFIEVFAYKFCLSMECVTLCVTIH